MSALRYFRISKIKKLAFIFAKKTNLWRNNAVLLREVKYFRKIVIVAIVFTFLAAAFEGIGVGTLLAFLQSLTEPDAAPVRTGLAWFDVSILGINASSMERLYRISILILIITFLRAGSSYLGNLYSSVAQFKLAYYLRLRVFSQLQALSLSYFAKTRSGEVVNSVTNEIQLVMQAVGVMNFILIKSSTLFAYVISMFFLSWQLTILSVALFTLLTVGISTLFGRVREASFEKSSASGKYTSIAVEFINGIRTVNAFASQDFERERYERANFNFLQASTKAVSLQALIEPLAETAATTIIIVMIVLAFVALIPAGNLQVSSLLTFLFVLFRMMPLVKQLNGANAKLSSFQGSISNLEEVLRTDNKPYLRNGKKEFRGIRQGIEFRSVLFGHEPGQVILNNINLIIECGKTTALVGSSGAGKSTLADLIPRFYDATSGQVLADGIDIRQFDTTSLRHKIAIVSQDTFIFNDSIRNNIAYALEEVDDARVWEAAKQANALDFVRELSNGLDTQLGDRGVQLSGGQRQRIAIARALLRNPEILILDEATSALDSVSERLIQESIEKLAEGRTVISIAHRLSTITKADKIVVLEKGKIVEQGSYQELISQNGKLWEYHQAQYKST
jgi:subfamily B ATP-binding cassette protein MsbA